MSLTPTNPQEKALLWIAGIVILLVILIPKMGGEPIHWFFFGFLAIVYFVPTVVAFRRKWRKEDIVATSVFNILLGWTIIGWLIALGLAYTREGPWPGVDRKTALTLMSADWKTDSRGVRHLVGFVKNNFGRPLTGVTVTFNLYDGSGNVIGNAIERTAELDAYGTWKFETTVDPRAERAELKQIVGL